METKNKKGGRGFIFENDEKPTLLDEGTRAAIEDEMLRVFRKLSPKKQECVIQVARTLVSEGLGNEE